jgi:hypothetical protein
MNADQNGLTFLIKEGSITEPPATSFTTMNIATLDAVARRSLDDRLK